MEEKNQMSKPCCSRPNIEEVVKESYGKLWTAEKEGKVPREESTECCETRVHDDLLNELAPHKGMKVLDIGCGSGETVLKIAKKVGPTGKAVGLDFTPEGIALAREKAQKQNLEDIAEFHEGNAQKLPFPSNHFDAVISECVVCLIEDKQKVLNEKVRVLKPGGRVIMHDVINWAPMPKTMREDPRLYCGCIGGAVSLNDYVEMMKKAGLTNIKTVDYTKQVQKLLNKEIVWQATEKIKDEKVFQEIIDFVRKGGIGYAFFSGTKKSA